MTLPAKILPDLRISKADQRRSQIPKSLAIDCFKNVKLADEMFQDLYPVINPALDGYTRNKSRNGQLNDPIAFLNKIKEKSNKAAPWRH
ncbi:hypothetical protein LCER1_G000230 [Lachnellula cervina]|uniref:Uncharacterized protein n=1 Tax=Lachnellula cervina TaxID=1316786 RepID=A0A7D8UXC5_9HELO|nr:hypothetical protein LCER1_G000230 [Lachnellula cervina]